MKPLVILAGPTAVGKTALSIKLAKKINGAVISADSMQVYKHMDIGSAKPSYEEIKKYNYKMIDIVEPSFNFNIKDYLEIFKNVIENIDIDKEGKDILIGFNPRFLIDALKVIDDETISIYLVNPKAPCFIRDDEENYTYLILPVNINQNQAR